MPLEFYPLNCKDNHMSSYGHRWWGTIFRYSIETCIGNTIHSLVICLRVLPSHVTNITNKYKIVWLPLEFNPQNNCKDNHILLSINIDDGIIFKYSIPRCNGNTIHSLVILSRVVPLRAVTNTTTKYKKLCDCPWNSIQETTKTIIYHHIWKWMMELSPNVLFKGVFAT